MAYCKNCIFWQPYKGDEPTMPRRSSHACVARTFKFKDPDGNDKVAITALKRIRDEDTATRTVVMRDTDPAPHYGQRTKPKFTCQASKAKHQPKLRGDFPAIPKPVKVDA